MERKNCCDPIDFRLICEELSGLMLAAEKDIKMGVAENLYSLKAHWRLMEEGWRIMLPRSKKLWPNFDSRLIEKPLLSWPDQLLVDGKDFLLSHRNFRGLENLYFFGYAVASGKLIKTSFMVSKYPENHDVYFIAFKEIVVDPFCAERGIKPDYYIGCPVELQDISCCSGNPLENFIIREEEERHQNKMHQYYLGAYQALLNNNPHYFPKPLVKFADNGGFYLPKQTEELSEEFEELEGIS